MSPKEYLIWLRDKRGLPPIAFHAFVNEDARRGRPSICKGGVFGKETSPGEWPEGAYCVAMPGTSTAYLREMGAVTMEELDDAGQVVRSTFIDAEGDDCDFSFKVLATSHPEAIQRATERMAIHFPGATKIDLTNRGPVGAGQGIAYKMAALRDGDFQDETFRASNIEEAREAVFYHLCTVFRIGVVDLYDGSDCIITEADIDHLAAECDYLTLEPAA